MKTSLRTSLLALPLSAALLLPQLALGASGAVMTGKTIDTACIQRAVDAREGSLLTAVTTFTTSIQAAYTARKNTLHDAWALTDSKQRKEAIKTAWKTFKDAKKAARKKFKDDSRAAWKTFRTAAKSCKGGATDTSDVGGEATDMEP